MGDAMYPYGDIGTEAAAGLSQGNLGYAGCDSDINHWQ